jgi:antitoxin HicB
MLRYPVKLKLDTNGSLTVAFRDLPEAHTFGEEEPDALRRAVDALETALILYMEEKRDIPQPTRPNKGERVIALPALSEAKITLYQTMRDAKVRKSELARRLGWHMPQVDRLLDLRHHSRLDQLEAAFAALDKRLTVRVVSAA